MKEILSQLFQIQTAFPLLGYLSGSLTFAYWLPMIFRGIDIREAGSHHASTTNTIRQAGWVLGVTVLMLDIFKGFIPVYGAYQVGASPWIIGLTAAAAVIGHCWPVFARFKGGMGLATAGGAYLAVAPLGFAIMLGVLIALTLMLRHGARASVIVGLVSGPVLLLFGLRGEIVYIGVFSGIVLVIRFLSDWRREYRELWLDRDQPVENKPADL